MKICFTCKIEKEFINFAKRSAVKDGYRSNCKECEKKWKKEHIKYDPIKNSIQCAKYREKHKDKLKKKRKKYYEDNREEILKRRRLSCPKQKMKKAESDKRWRDKNLEKCREKSKKWKEENREKYRIIQRNRKARKRGAEGSYKAEDVILILKLQKNKCAICRRNLKDSFHVDHIIPIAKNGTNHKNNLQMLCPTCNHQKSAKDPIYFMRQKGYLI